MLEEEFETGQWNMINHTVKPRLSVEPYRELIHSHAEVLSVAASQDDIADVMMMTGRGSFGC